MSTHLCITVRWIGDRFHGFIDGTESIEWPPSPFRLFQAFVASAHRHGMTESRQQALAWLERQENAPELLAVADPATGVIFDHWVPDNDNLVSHRKGSIRKSKPILHGDRPLVHYVWPINQADQPSIEALDDLAATLGWLGWAIDFACATATLASVEQFDSEKLPENSLCRFQPVAKSTRTDGSLRVAKSGSTVELERLHSINRVSFSDQTQRRRKKWPKVFDRYIYFTADCPAPRPHVVFKLLDDDLDTTSYPQALLTHIGAVVRHAAITSMAEGRNAPPWIPEAERGSWACRFVRGKKDSEHDSHQQISYVPLPSIGHEHSDAMIRNVMLIAPIGHERELEYVAERLNGVPLEFKDASEEYEADVPPRFTRPSTIQRFTPPKGKFIDRWYLDRSTVWQSVTPVILDEHIDKRTRVTTDGQTTKYRDPEDFERLIKLALQRAGIETPCRFTWQALPFYKNCLTAHRYDRDNRFTFLLPKRLDGRTAVHVRLHFDYPVSGPITLGAGRHCGFGLFAASGGSERGGAERRGVKLNSRRVPRAKSQVQLACFFSSFSGSESKLWVAQAAALGSLTVAALGELI